MRVSRRSDLPRLARIAAVMVAGACIGAPTPASAQDASRDTIAPMAVVRELFDAMRAGDSARVRAVFHPQMVALNSADVGKDGVARVSQTTIDAFAKAIGTPHPAVYDERLYNPRALVDGTLASVWVDYSFFVGTQFSHCGIDVFQLAKVGSGWKIIALADTRRTTGCAGT